VAATAAQIFSDVQFDFGAAAESVAQLRQTATELQANTEQRTSLGQRALKNWRGRYARKFQDPWKSQLNTAFELMQELLRTATRIEQAMASAQQEQRLRERARIEHWNELASDEDRRATEAEARGDTHAGSLLRERAAEYRQEAAAAQQAAYERQNSEQAQIESVTIGEGSTRPGRH
jgi:hypothetical protein